jgi:hypothetical protein
MFRDNLWGPFFSVLDFLTPEEETDRLSRNVGQGFTTTRCETTRKSVNIIHIAAEAWNHAEYSQVSNNKCNTQATQDLEVKGDTADNTGLRAEWLAYKASGQSVSKQILRFKPHPK